MTKFYNKVSSSSITVTKHHDRGNLTEIKHLFGAHGCRWLESMAIMVGSVATGRQAGIALEPELRAHIFIHSKRQRELTGNGMEFFETSKPTGAHLFQQGYTF